MDNFFYDGKAETGAFFVFSAGEICLIETFPDFFQAVFWNTDAGIPDRNKYFFILAGGFYCDGGICVAEFDGIINQVVEYLLNLAFVGIDERMPFGKKQVNGNML